MDQFQMFIQQLDQTLAQDQTTTTMMVYVPVTFSFQQRRLQVAIPSLQTSFNQGANQFGVNDILARIRELVGVELAERPVAQWPRQKVMRQLTITPYKVVRIIPVDMQAYRVD